MNNSRHTFLLFALCLFLAVIVMLLVASSMEGDEPTKVDARSFVPVVDETTTTTTTEAPTTTSTAPPTTLAPQTRKAVFQAAYASEVAELIREGFARFGATVVEEALSVSWCESRHVATARNGVHVGPFQLSGTYHRERAARMGFTWEQVATEARANIAVAADLYAEQGWGPWQCKP